MNKVISINLNGRAYQFEEAGYDILKKYLETAEAKLHDNPDKTEIMADFEQAIADKCDAVLSGHKNVVSTKEIEDIIGKMGPVEGDAKTEGSAEHAARTATAGTREGPKRLYKIPAGEWLFGVCTGLGAYFNVDTNIIRAVFIALTIVTHGFWALVYVVLAIVLPIAHTPEEMENAHGTHPFNAHDFIEQAKMRYAEFKANNPPGDHASQRAWYKQQRQWKKQQRDEWRAKMREQTHNQWAHQAHQEHGNGFFRFIMGLIIFALTLLWIATLVTIIRHQTFFGFMIATGHPLWMSILFVTALFYVLITPFQLFAKNARARTWSAQWARYNFFTDVVQSLFFILACYLVIYLGRELFPLVNAGYSMVISSLLK